jgi:hypothetical protein
MIGWRLVSRAALSEPEPQCNVRGMAAAGRRENDAENTVLDSTKALRKRRAAEMRASPNRNCQSSLDRRYQISSTGGVAQHENPWKAQSLPFLLPGVANQRNAFVG